LRATGHVEVGVVLERDAAEEQSDDTCDGSDLSWENGAPLSTYRTFRWPGQKSRFRMRSARPENSRCLVAA
jgi:hypothetical protein